MQVMQGFCHAGDAADAGNVGDVGDSGRDAGIDSWRF